MFAVFNGALVGIYYEEDLRFVPDMKYPLFGEEIDDSDDESLFGESEDDSEIGESDSSDE